MTVHELASDGSVEVADVAGGSIADTYVLGADIPGTKPGGLGRLARSWKSLATGVYFYRLEAGETVVTRKAVLLK